MTGGERQARLRVGVLVSGRGSNLQAILDAIVAGRVTAAEVVVVISNRSDAPALARAAEASVPAICIPQRDYPDRTAHHAAIADALDAHGAELVVTAGFNRILDPGVIARFPDRIVNVHPSLLPAFAGTLHAQAAALAFGVKVTGCTVHLVDNVVDGGPIIAQQAVTVRDDDTEESLAARILAAEHELLPSVIQWFGEGRVRRDGRHVRLEQRAPANPARVGPHDQTVR
ncbi:MAG: phosphoribosylglycinamide formyltransferase [Chloroflexi bacterium]|nr:phosphoribosylglycinamide formyltransferase [Chloroflexota bacterium]